MIIARNIKERFMNAIIFNGKTYNSIDEMPSAERQMYEQMTAFMVDNNGNGIPDFLEGDIVRNVMNVYSSTKAISVNGQTFNNMNELPLDVREKVQHAFGVLSENGLTQSQSGAAPIANSIPVTRFNQGSSPSAIQDGNSLSPWLLAGIGLALMICLMLGAAAAFFFMQ
jgi:hypothetical protein